MQRFLRTENGLYSLIYISVCVRENVTRFAIVVWFVKNTEVSEEVIKLAIRNGITSGRDMLIIFSRTRFQLLK
jgi:hypothetical protein